MTARCGYVRAVDFEKGYGNGTRSHFSVCVRLRGNGFAGHLTAGDHEPDIANHRLINLPGRRRSQFSNRPNG